MTSIGGCWLHLRRGLWEKHHLLWLNQIQTLIYHLMWVCLWTSKYTNEDDINEYFLCVRFTWNRIYGVKKLYSASARVKAYLWTFLGLYHLHLEWLCFCDESHIVSPNDFWKNYSANKKIMRQDHTSRQVCAQQWFICSKHKADGNKLKPCQWMTFRYLRTIRRDWGETR